MSALQRLVCFVSLAVLVSMALPRGARAQGARSQAVPVLSIDSDDSDEQADALTQALRSHIRQTPGWTLQDTTQSLSMMTAAFQCPQRPDTMCQTRIGDKLKTDQFFWGVLSKAPGHQVTAELHFWSRGKPDKVARETFSDNLKDANDDNLKRVATSLFGKLLGGSTGTIAVHANSDGGTVLVDGVAAGTLSGGRASIPLAVGPHAIEVQAPGFAPAKRQVTVEPGGTSPVEVTLEASAVAAPASEPSSPLPVRKIVGWSAVAAGAVLVGVGIGFGVAELNDQSDLNSARQNNYLTGSRVPVADPCNPPTSPTPNTIEGCNAVSSSHTALAVEITTLALGGVAVGVGAYLLLTDHPSETASPPPQKTGLASVHFLPGVGPGGGSMVVLGQF